MIFDLNPCCWSKLIYLSEKVPGNIFAGLSFLILFVFVLFSFLFFLLHHRVNLLILFIPESCVANPMTTQ